MNHLRRLILRERTNAVLAGEMKKICADCLRTAARSAQVHRDHRRSTVDVEDAARGYREEPAERQGPDGIVADDVNGVRGFTVAEEHEIVGDDHASEHTLEDTLARGRPAPETRAIARAERDETDVHLLRVDDTVAHGRTGEEVLLHLPGHRAAAEIEPIQEHCLPAARSEVDEDAAHAVEDWRAAAELEHAALRH